MQTWAYLLGGLIVWAIQFFAVYAASSIFLTSTTTRVITALMTFACLTAAAAVATRGWAGQSRDADPSERWVHTMACLSGATAFLAIA